MQPGVDGALVERLRLACAKTLPAHPVRVAYLYGSQAAGTARPDSDVDVGLLLDAPSPDIEFRVADALTTAVRRGNIDVTVLDGAPLRFLGRVLRARVVLYSRDEPARVEWESLTARMADDVEVWAAPLDRELIARAARGH
jgi:uncharacterized protein